MKESLPKITVLMSIYNGERHIAEAVESVLTQNFRDFELLLVNDASTDKTDEIIHTFKDSRIRIVKNPKNLGLTRSLNIGLKLARGEFIARLDADDVSFPNRLRRQHDFLNNNRDAGLVSSQAEVIDDSGKIVRYWDINLSSEQIFYEISFYNCICGSSVMYRKDIVLDIGGYNEKYKLAQDFDLWQRLSRKTRFYTIKENLIRYRITKDGITLKNKNKQNATALEIAKDNFGITENIFNYFRNTTKKIPLLKKILILLELADFNKRIIVECNKLAIKISTEEIRACFYREENLIDEILNSFNVEGFEKLNANQMEKVLAFIELIRIEKTEKLAPLLNKLVKIESFLSLMLSAAIKCMDVEKHYLYLLYAKIFKAFKSDNACDFEEILNLTESIEFKKFLLERQLCLATDNKEVLRIQSKIQKLISGSINGSR